MMQGRRRLLQFGLGMAVVPLLRMAEAGNDTSAAAGLTRAENFAHSGMKGFALGGVTKKDVAYFDALAATGARLGRVFFPFRKCASCTQFGRAANDIAAFRQILDWSGERGLRLVVVADFDEVDKATFWSNEALRDSMVDNWRWFARTFGNHPVLAGLDLLNEPNPPWTGGTLAGAHASWRPLAARAIAAIRAEGVTLPIVYEGVAGSGSLGLRDFQPFADRQIVYSIHHYVPHDITHQHVAPAWSRTIPYPAGPEWQLGGWDAELGPGPWNRQRMEKDLRDVIAFQRRYKVPIYVGEFSCVRWAPDGSRQRFIADCLDIYRKYGWSWTYHEFRGWPGWDAEIDSEVRGDDLTAHTLRTPDAPVMKLLREAMTTPRTSVVASPS